MEGSSKKERTHGRGQQGGTSWGRGGGRREYEGINGNGKNKIKENKIA